MNAQRKKAVALVTAGTAIALLALAICFESLYLIYPVDPVYVDNHLKQVRKFDVDGARKAGYTDEEIATHLAKVNRSESNRLWQICYILIGTLYVVWILGVAANTLSQEAKEPTAD